MGSYLDVPEDVQFFRVRYETFDGNRYRLDTIDSMKIGPWIAEMFELFPWHPSRGDNPVSIQSSTITKGS